MKLEARVYLCPLIKQTDLLAVLIVCLCYNQILSLTIYTFERLSTYPTTRWLLSNTSQPTIFLFATHIPTFLNIYIYIYTHTHFQQHRRQIL